MSREREIRAFLDENDHLLETLRPYDTADKIIAKVLSDGKASRSDIVLVLMEYGAECIKNQKEFEGNVKEFLLKEQPKDAG